MERGLLADPGKDIQKRAVFWKTNPDFRFRIISEDLKTNFSKIPWKDFPAIHNPDHLGKVEKIPRWEFVEIFISYPKKFACPENLPVRKSFECHKILKLIFGKKIQKNSSFMPRNG